MRLPGPRDRRAAPPWSVSASRTLAVAARLTRTSARSAAQLPACPAALSSISRHPPRPHALAAPGACGLRRLPGPPAAAPAHHLTLSCRTSCRSSRCCAMRRVPACPAHAATQTTTKFSAPSKPPSFTTTKARPSCKTPNSPTGSFLQPDVQRGARRAGLNLPAACSARLPRQNLRSCPQPPSTRTVETNQRILFR
jgi:hypothetical protein